MVMATAGDRFVTQAHGEPVLAERWLGRYPRMARAIATWSERAIDAAAHCGHRRLLHKLLRYGAEHDLFTACASGDLRLTRAELQSYADEPLGIHRLPLLHFAIVNDDLEMLEALIGEGVALNPAGASVSPLHSAVAHGDSRMLEALLDAGADPQAKDALGASAIDWAADLHSAGSLVFEVLEQAG